MGSPALGGGTGRHTRSPALLLQTLPGRGLMGPLGPSLGQPYSSLESSACFFSQPLSQRPIREGKLLHPPIAQPAFPAHESPHRAQPKTTTSSTRLPCALPAGSASWAGSARARTGAAPREEAVCWARGRSARRLQLAPARRAPPPPRRCPPGSRPLIQLRGAAGS